MGAMEQRAPYIVNGVATDWQTQRHLCKVRACVVPPDRLTCPFIWCERPVYRSERPKPLLPGVLDVDRRLGTSL